MCYINVINFEDDSNYVFHLKILETPLQGSRLPYRAKSLQSRQSVMRFVVNFFVYKASRSVYKAKIGVKWIGFGYKCFSSLGYFDTQGTQING